MVFELFIISMPLKLSGLIHAPALIGVGSFFAFRLPIQLSDFFGQLSMCIFCTNWKIWRGRVSLITFGKRSAFTQRRDKAAPSLVLAGLVMCNMSIHSPRHALEVGWFRCSRQGISSRKLQRPQAQT